MIDEMEMLEGMLKWKQRVLLVDDDLLQLHLTRDRLEEAGYAVQTAGNADEALEKTYADPPDAILSNACGGDFDGFNLCKKLREDARLANVPVILLSERPGHVEDRDLSARAGATQLITRTPDFDAELSALDTTLHQEAPVACDAKGAEHYEQMLRSNALQITRLMDRVQSCEHAREELEAAEDRYRSLVERIPDVIWRGRSDGGIVFATPNVARVLGYTPAELAAQSASERENLIHPDERRMAKDALAAFCERGTPFDIEYRILRRDGRYTWVRNRAMGLCERDGVTLAEGILSEINDRKLLEESLHQAQKMEAIGQLTGGIAHDFNNILAAILTNSHFLMEGLEGDPRQADANEIREAAERAASLTRQLLAFSRRQVLEPSIVDLNHALEGIKRMLCRVIGEDIVLTLVAGNGLGSVRVDLGQLEQVIMNLAVNARDAMPEGGRLTLETANVDLDEAYDASEGHVPAGKYVMVAVSDTGSGMDAATRKRIFEPFFTTKELGKGTGLGLSTCYGIVKQSGGHIWVHSEVGCGSVFKIYLPRVEEAFRRERRSTPRASRPTGSETILVVEDDEGVRVAVTRVLVRAGFQLLVARDSEDAIALARAHEGSVDLLLTDVVMPGSSGPEVAATIREQSGCKVLLMSGYSDHSALRGGDLTTVAGFIQKPFSPNQLLRKAREILDA